jgi:hypothetical protein
LATQHIFAMDETMPLLSQDAELSVKYIQEAIMLLKNIGYYHDATTIMNAIHQTKTSLQKICIIEHHLKLFEYRSNFIKKNYVTIDKNGNMSEYSSHKLDPVICLLRLYVGK